MKELESPKWVFWSTRESVAKNIPSIAAIIETIIAVVLSWWIAYHSGAYLLLLASAMAAPLVLLRSDEAVALGVIWFTRWANTTRSNLSDSKEIKWSILSPLAAIPIVASIAFVFFSSKYSVHDVNVGLALAFVIGWLSLTIAIAAGVLIHQAVGGEAAPKAIVKLTLVLIFTNAFVFIVAGAAPEATLALVAGLCLGAISGALAYIGTAFIFWTLVFTAPVVAAAVTLKTQKSLVFAATAVFTSLVLSSFLSPVFFGFIFGVLVTAVLVRLAATLRYWVFGLRKLPENFRRLTLCMSPTHEPELIPGLPVGSTGFTLSETIDQLSEKLKSKNYDEKIFAVFYYVPVVIVWFFPSWLYRITLKSTAWFWWPLAYLGAPLKLANRPGEFRRVTIGSLWAKTNIVLAALTLTIFIVTNLFRTQAIFHSNPLITALGYAFLIDWSAILPWQFLSLCLAALSLIIVYLVDDAEGQLRQAVSLDDASVRDRAHSRLQWIERIVRFRFVLFLIFNMLVAGQTSLYVISLRCSISVPIIFQDWAEFIYGDRMLDKCS